MTSPAPIPTERLEELQQLALTCRHGEFAVLVSQSECASAFTELLSLRQQAQPTREEGAVRRLIKNIPSIIEDHTCGGSDTRPIVDVDGLVGAITEHLSALLPIDAPAREGGGETVEALLETTWQAILDGPTLSAATLPRLANCGRYLAQDNTGQWHYINHAGEWQTCPPPSAGTRTSGWDRSVDAVDALPFSLSDLERSAQSVRGAIELLESNGYDILAPSAARVPQWKEPAADDIEAAWLELIEKDDRTSPSDYPDHALITKDELRSIIVSFAPAEPAAQSLQTLAPAPDAVKPGDET